MDNKEIEQMEFKDVFISHSWKDKIKFIEPLVAALEASGIRCWYDLMEIKPGDSLIEKINYGLTHSKVILLCLSKNFLEGKWSTEELEASLSLATINKNTIRIIPIMLEDPEPIVNKYPMQLAKLVHIQWSNNIDRIIDEIKKVVTHIDGIGKEYWLEHAKIAYNNNEFIKSALYARKTLEFDKNDYAANIYFISSILHLNKSLDAFKFIYEKQDEWPYIANDQVDENVLDYAQDNISYLVNGDEIDETGFTFAIVGFLGTEHNMSRAWKYLVRLYNKEKFKFHQSDIVKQAAFMGKEAAMDWLANEVTNSNDEKVKESLVTMLGLFAHRLPQVKDKSISILKKFLNDYFEDIRALALIPYYMLAKDGSEQAIKALHDKSPMVRAQAFELLSGSYNMIITENWELEESYEDRKADPLLTPDLVAKLLQDPDDMVVEEVIEKISEGKIDCPQGIDLENLSRPPSEEIREAQVKMLGKKDTKDNHDKLIEFALNDPSEFVRSEAIDILKESKLPINSNILRKMYEEETISRVKDDLDNLILEKGDNSLADIYVEILSRSMDSMWPSDKALEKTLKSRDQNYIAKALNICQKNNKQKLAAKQLLNIIRVGNLKDAVNVVDWCLQNKEELENALLAAGLLSEIPFEKISMFHKDENLLIRINALRAAEKRTGDGRYLNILKELYNQLKLKVSKENGDIHWAILYTIDGVLEFEGKQEAVRLLKEYYSIATKEKEGSFPIRAAWERLKILGIDIPHKVYDDSEPTVPYPWPDRDGTFYLKISEVT